MAAKQGQWQDGSRFLIASGVKWGSGPKYYKGSERDTPWNKDLLWKLYVEQEARKMKIPLRIDEHDKRLEAQPPYMRSLAAATNPDVKPDKLWDPYRHDEFKTGTVLTERQANWKDLQGPHGLPLIHRGSPRSWRDRRQGMDEEKRALDGMKMATQTGADPSEALRKLADVDKVRLAAQRRPETTGGAGGSTGSARRSLPAVSARASTRGSARSSSGTAEILRRMELLEAKIAREHDKAEALEGELGSERKARSRMNKKLQAYDQIMRGLMEAVKSGGKVPEGLRMPQSGRASTARSGARSGR
mmetsp:Transcript_28208/g.66748  ORF Transcript_28208/g.66748 Transcript_28208/m.66748 type:complete len:303 (-) Transcript_28208:123-1031(-)